MDINHLTIEDIFRYGRDKQFAYLSGDYQYCNTYPEVWTIPDLAEFECEYDHSDDRYASTSLYHYGCCKCGCGETTTKWYAPGHDQKHYGKLIRQWFDSDIEDAMALIRYAQEYASEGVWSKFIERFGFAVHATTVASGVYRYVAVGDSNTLVTKVGRWYYPVVRSPYTLQFYRSTKTLTDRFFDGHEFTIKVHSTDVDDLYKMQYLQERVGA